MDKEMSQEYYALLEEIQAVDFVLVELTLYLDTHPQDYQAIQQFNQYAKQSKHLKKQYESLYGPLRQYGESYSSYPWNWADAPWPWQV
ncbi:spore coat protein CotJB [Pontibacillus litoralis]|uniref:Spore coat protein CotJB n=1 Tax=Pontibacillus litoralis JSM 072002 TaxID=1385512 RepID=A0A0A5G7L1_9BACI|nr:spore coat protein CotJB [Pontibacillus litoralis]KGX87994.1 spore coat protein CotJB [Pontibacillus litoralis JSM 072002]